MSKRANRIKDKIPLDQVLSDYGYHVYTDHGDQQFSCDLHGDGNDGRPSARFYSETNTWYCFACGKVRDSISTVMEKQGVDFSSACKLLELKYGLPVWEYKKEDTEDIDFNEDDISLIKDITIRRLQRLTTEKVLSLQDSLMLWEAVNLMCCTENQSNKMWYKIYVKIKNKENQNG